MKYLIFILCLLSFIVAAVLLAINLAGCAPDAPRRNPRRVASH